MKTNYLNQNYQEVSIENIQIHPLVIKIVRPKKVEHIKFTMDRFGQQLPVVGKWVNDIFLITDGVVRFEVAKSLNWETLKCIDIEISEEDVIKLRLTANQKTQMSFTEISVSAEHILGVIGTCQGKKRDVLGFGDFLNDENYGSISMDRFELAIHLLNLPLGASSLRKLMAVKWFEDENPGNKLKLMQGLDNGDFKVDKAYKLLLKKQEKQKNIDNRRLSAIEGDNAICSYKLFNKSSMVMDEIQDETVSLFLDSHPYEGGQRDYRNQGDNPHGMEKTTKEYVENFVKFCQEKMRKLKPGGYMVTILGESYRDGKCNNVIHRVIVALEDDGWEPIDTNIWVKSNQRDTAHPCRFRNVWESVIVMRKPGGEPFFQEQVNQNNPEGEFELGKTSNGEPYIKSPETSITNVFTTPVFNNKELKSIDKDFKHDAPCPTSIYEKFIKAYSKPKDLIVDGFVGSGTLVIGLYLGRDIIGYDVDPKSIEFCQKRFDKCLDEKIQNQEEIVIAA